MNKLKLSVALTDAQIEALHLIAEPGETIEEAAADILKRDIPAWLQVAERDIYKKKVLLTELNRRPSTSRNPAG